MRHTLLSQRTPPCDRVADGNVNIAAPPFHQADVKMKNWKYGRPFRPLLGSPPQPGQSHMTKPYPKPRPRSGATLVVLVGAGFKPALVRHSNSSLQLAAWGTWPC